MITFVIPYQNERHKMTEQSFQFFFHQVLDGEETNPNNNNESDEETEEEIFDDDPNTSCREITPDLHATMQTREKYTDKPFDRSQCDSIVGSKLPELSETVLNQPGDLFDFCYATSIHEMLHCTNTLITKYNIQHQYTPSSKLFVPLVTLKELYTFHGLVLIMCLAKGPAIHVKSFIRKLYKEQNDILFCQIGKDAKKISVMTYDRYIQINDFIHQGGDKVMVEEKEWKKRNNPDGGEFITVYDSSGQPKQTIDNVRLFEPLINQFNSNSLKVYDPKGTVCIDELMTPSKTKKNKMKTYNPGKKHKRGVLFYSTNCSYSKFCLKLQVLYPSGQKKPQFRTVIGLVEFLTQELWNTNTLLVTDRWYSSIDNCLKMYSHGMYMLTTGSFTKIKNTHPQIEKRTKNTRDDPWQRSVKVFLSKSDSCPVYIVTYHDKKSKDSVLFFTTSNNLLFQEGDYTHPNKRYINIVSKGHSQLLGSISRPHVVHVYNFTMNGTDDFDNLKHKHEIALRYTKSEKWIRRIVFQLRNMEIVNVYLLYKSRTSAKLLTSTQFMFTLAYDWLTYNQDFSPVCSPKSSSFTTCNHCPRTKKRRSYYLCTCLESACTNHLFMVCLDCLTDKMSGIKPFGSDLLSVADTDKKNPTKTFYFRVFSLQKNKTVMFKL